MASTALGGKRAITAFPTLIGDPGRTPTCDLGVRKALLYAAELRGHGDDLAVQVMGGKMGENSICRFGREDATSIVDELWLIDVKIQYVAGNK